MARRHRHRSHRRRRSMRGGYSSASTYALATAGTPNQQYDRTFMGSGNTSNVLQPIGVNDNLQYAPTSQNLQLVQSAGSGTQQHNTVHHMAHNTAHRVSSHRGGSRRRRGGNWGQVVGNAIVPFGILGMQQTFKKRGGTRHNKSRRHRRH